MQTKLKISASRIPLYLAVFLLIGALGSCKVEDGPTDMGWDELVSSHRHWQKTDGPRMHYIDIGQGEPIVMIHGFADSTYCWHKNVRPLLDSGHRLILVDLPGLGQSDLPSEDMTLTAMNLGDKVIELIDQLEIENFSLIGSSMGGAISLWISYRLPERVTRTVLFDPACYWQKKSGFLSLIDLPGAAQVMGRWSIELALKDVYYDGDKLTDTIVSEYARPLTKPGYSKFLVRLLEDFASPEAVKFSEKYSEIKAPTLIFWGTEDRWVTPEFGPRLNEALPDSRLEMIEKAGHLPHQERPEVVNPLLLEFFRGPLPASLPAL